MQGLIDILSIIYVTVLAVSFLSSFIAIKKEALGKHLKFLCALLACTLVVEFYSVIIVPRFHLKTNVQVYNIFMLIEFMFYGFYYKNILRSPWIRRLINSYLFIFPAFWAIVVFVVFGLFKWNSYVVIAGSFFIILFSIFYYYQVFTDTENINLGKNSEFWIATGLIVYYSCNLPYIGMLNFLVKNNIALAKTFLAVLLILNILMYSLFTYAYLCRIPTKKLLLY